MTYCWHRKNQWRDCLKKSSAIFFSKKLKNVNMAGELEIILYVCMRVPLCRDGKSRFSSSHLDGKQWRWSGRSHYARLKSVGKKNEKKIMTRCSPETTYSDYLLLGGGWDIQRD